MRALHTRMAAHVITPMLLNWEFVMKMNYGHEVWGISQTKNRKLNEEMIWRWKQQQQNNNRFGRAKFNNAPPYALNLIEKAT